MKQSIRRRLDREKRKIAGRLERLIGGAEPREDGQPELRASGIAYDLAQRTHAIPCGGVGAIMRLADSVGLPAAINEHARVLKIARPYRDSNHVLNIALNLLCGGEVLEDIEIRRNDAAFLDAPGARAIPDPTTAGDYLRRFGGTAVWRLMHAVNNVRAGAWRRSGVAQGTARIDADSSIVHEGRMRLRCVGAPVRRRAASRRHRLHHVGPHRPLGRPWCPLRLRSRC